MSTAEEAFDVLPESIKSYAQSLQDYRHLNKMAFALAAMSTVGHVIHGRYQSLTDQPPVLFVLLEGGSGTGKSPIVKAAMGPMTDYKMEFAAKVSTEFERKKELLQRQAGVDDKGRRQREKGKPPEPRTDEEHVAHAELQRHLHRRRPKLYSSDFTPEALARLAVHRHGLMVASGEIAMRQIENESVIDALASMYVGEESSTDRVGSTTQDVDSAGFHLDGPMSGGCLLGLQPGFADRFIDNAYVIERGVRARFIRYTIEPTPAKAVDPEPLSSLQRYHDTVSAILRSDDGHDYYDSGYPLACMFGQDASDRLYELSEALCDEANTYPLASTEHNIIGRSPDRLLTRVAQILAVYEHYESPPASYDVFGCRRQSKQGPGRPTDTYP